MMVSKEEFDKKFEQFFQNKEENQKKDRIVEEMRQSFVNDYPIDKIKDLTLEEYCCGFKKIASKDKHINYMTFSYRLEFDTNEICGIRGANASKHGVYYSSKGEYEFVPKYGATLDEAFKTVKEEIYDLLTNGETLTQEQFDRCLITPMIKSKLLMIYYPKLYCNTANNDQLKKILDLVGVKHEENLGIIDNNKLFINWKNNNEKFKNFSNYLFMRFIYNSFQISTPQSWNGKKNQDNNDKIEYWPSLDEYTPGISKQQWIELLNDTDVTSNDNLAMLKLMLELGGEATCAKLSEVSNKTSAAYNMLGSSFGQKIYKKINCPLMQQDGHEYYFTIPFVGRSVKEDGINRYSWKLRIELKEALEEMDLSGIDNTKKIKYDKNLILYGPPGTGKTYNTVNYAVSIIENISIEDVIKRDRSEVKEAYDKYVEEGRIGFTTFHQSYGYEEFIEGIKPIVDPNKSEVGYRIEPGIFKQFCDDSRIINEEDKKYHRNVWAIRNRSNSKDMPTDFEERLYKDGVIKIDNLTDAHRQNDLFNKMSRGDWVVFGRDYTINAIGVLLDDEAEEINDGIFHYQRKVEWKATNLNADCRPINDGKVFSNFAVAWSVMKIQDLQKLIYGDKVNTEPYVFIIDEINRGNISKIFGELITLIEPSKREGCVEATSVILPYSNTKFSVPDNVYILGTMNTADRSIALMDTALRRRFSFVEMQPDASLLKDKQVEGIDLQAMLTSINERIEYLYDREHTIGHSFFMHLDNHSTVEDLAEVFKKNIIPLLQEYFFEDYQKIQLVLCDTAKSDDQYKFILEETHDVDTLFKKSIDGDEYDLDRKKYKINEKAFYEVESYKQIY